MVDQPESSRLSREALTAAVTAARRAFDQAADLGLFSSDMESFCLSILEAMCFESPSVTTSVGGIPEVTLDGQTGLLVPAGDAAALARGVETLISDPLRRRTLGLAAQRRAREKFSAAVIVPQYEALYRRVCGLA